MDLNEYAKMCHTAAGYSGWWNDLDIEGALREKMQYNARRADHKPQNRRLPGGKKT